MNKEKLKNKYNVNQKLKERLSSYKKFISIYFQNPIKVGSIVPSSDSLTQAITNMADLSNKNCVVELGPGTGVFTEKILQKINLNTCFFCLELNEQFVKETMKRCPQARVYHNSAEKIQYYLSLHDKSNCDTIISSLPWTIFDDDTQNALLESIYKSIKPGGDFFTYIYLTGMYLPGGVKFIKKLKKKFSNIKKSNVIWKNFPPVIIYHCHK